MAAPDYPRIGSILISGPQNMTSLDYTYCNWVVWGPWPTMGGSSFANSIAAKAAHIAAAKAENPNIKIFPYTKFNEVHNPTASNDDHKVANKVNDDNRWLRNAAGSIINVVGDRGINGTGWMDQARGGQPFYEWLAVNNWTTWWSNVTGVDGIYIDNVNSNARTVSNADPDLDGDNDAVTAWDDTTPNGFQQSTVNYSNALRTAGAPLIFANVDHNIADWPLYVNKFDYALYEGLDVYGPSTWAGKVARMQATEDSILVVGGHLNDVQTSVTFTTNHASFATIRKWLTTVLITTNGAFGQSQGGYSNFNVFDEYKGGALNQLGYLGQPTQTRRTSAHTGTEWRRTFDNGIVIFNAGSSGSITVDVGNGVYRRINGSQCPAHNTGAIVNAPFSLNAQDGIILLLEAAPPAGPIEGTSSTVFNVNAAFTGPQPVVAGSFGGLA